MATTDTKFQILTDVTTPQGLDQLRLVIQQIEDYINSGVVMASDGNRYRFNGTTWVKV